ncbi:MAG: PGPGW domain-containing protein [Desulfobacterales bacterium]
MLKTLWIAITGFFTDHRVLLSWLGGLSLLMFLVSLITVPLVIVRLPVDYLRRNHKLLQDWPSHFSVPFLILKNGLGVMFLISGLAMLILPGQGFLTLFIGLAMVDFPRKHILIRRILGHRRIFPIINRVRTRFGKPELEAPPS